MARISTSSSSLFNKTSGQAWTEAERQAIRYYAAQNPKTTWRLIKRWFEGNHPNKELT